MEFWPFMEICRPKTGRLASQNDAYLKLFVCPQGRTCDLLNEIQKPPPNSLVFNDLLGVSKLSIGWRTQLLTAFQRLRSTMICV